MKVLSIVGARPQFIKVAPVHRAVSRTFDHEILHTGQHYDYQMSKVFFEELDIPEPDYYLGVGSGSHGQQTGKMLEEIEKVLMEHRPDVVLVYGDTNSTIAGALAAVVGAPPPPPLARDEDVCRVLACPPRDLSAPFLNAATWLLASSVQHPDPRDRLALARANLEAAAARDPDDPRVRFALALTHAALRGALLWDDDDLERLPGLGIAFGGRPCLAPDQRDAWLARFAGIGVPPDVLAALRRASDPATGRGCDPVLRDDADRQDPAER